MDDLDGAGDEPQRIAAFEREATRLFARVAEETRRQRAAHEAHYGPVEEDAVVYLFETAVVCVDHRRFVPCRRCLYDRPADRPYSNEPAAVASVRAHQLGRGRLD